MAEAVLCKGNARPVLAVILAVVLVWAHSTACLQMLWIILAGPAQLFLTVALPDPSSHCFWHLCIPTPAFYPRSSKSSQQPGVLQPGDSSPFPVMPCCAFSEITLVLDVMCSFRNSPCLAGAEPGQQEWAIWGSWVQWKEGEHGRGRVGCGTASVPRISSAGSAEEKSLLSPIKLQVWNTIAERRDKIAFIL